MQEVQRKEAYPNWHNIYSQPALKAAPKYGTYQEAGRRYTRCFACKQT